MRIRVFFVKLALQQIFMLTFLFLVSITEVPSASPPSRPVVKSIQRIISAQCSKHILMVSFSLLLRLKTLNASRANWRPHPIIGFRLICSHPPSLYSSESNTWSVWLGWSDIIFLLKWQFCCNNSRMSPSYIITDSYSRVYHIFNWCISNP